ncbi:Ger(x)C family spore germination protein [Paenibacillus sp. SI8]|uniref:Ger(x)C family spore germination protein n=1 Tax=unclassified Paenibacillus TaxID=185978 RepID=UPI0034657E74
MNQRLRYALLIPIVLVIVTGCSDRLDLEDGTIPLLAGYDLDKNNNFLSYAVNPVFSKNIEKKTQEIGLQAQTLRQSRGEADAFTAGTFQGSKFLVNLVSKRLLQQPGWFQMMDVYFRDPKVPLTARFVVYDGPLSEIIYLNPSDQPSLPLLLRGMIDTKSARSETVKTTTQELHRQMNEKGVTPSIAEIKLENKEIKLSGTVLLDHKGIYVLSLNMPETILLRILQNKAKKSVSLTLSIPGQPKSSPFAADKLSIATGKVKTKIKTFYRQGKFRFDFKIDVPAELTERFFPYDMQKDGQQLEAQIAEQVQKQLESLIHKIQEHKIDPIGLGLYARAHAYIPYMEVEDHWGEALAKADIHIAVRVTLTSSGPVK